MAEISLTVQTVSPAPGGATQTVITDYAKSVKDLEWTTNRMDSPGKLAFTRIEDGPIAIPEGSSVELAVNGVKVFKGYVFAIERNKEKETSYTAYDQLRYLKANASYTFENMTLTQIVQQIAADFGLTCGTLEDTGYAFPCLLKEDEECLNILYDALKQTIVQTGKIYLLYDNAGAISLIEVKNLLVQTLLGDGSLVTDYTYKRDIDSDTYNRVKLVKKNEETGRTDVYIHEDTDTIKKWGILQYYAQVDENMNEAQIDQLCQMYLQYYNRVLQTITLDAIGEIRIRAGSIVPVQVSGIDDLEMTRLLIAEKVTHTFDGDAHTMSVEVKSFEQLGGMSVI